MDILINNAATVVPLGLTASIPAALIAHLSGDGTGAVWDVTAAT